MSASYQYVEIVVKNSDFFVPLLTTLLTLATWCAVADQSFAAEPLSTWSYGTRANGTSTNGALAWLRRQGEATLTFDDEDIRKVVGVQLSKHLATDDGLARLQSLDSLKALEIWSDSADRLTDRGLHYASRLRGLEFLRAAPNRFTDRGMAHLKSVKSLRGLVLEPARISNAGLAELRDLCCLQSLSLNGSSIDDEGLAALDRMEHLEFLSLRRSHVTEACLPRLRGRVDKDLMTISGPYRLRVLALPYEIQLSDQAVVELIKTMGMTDLESVDPLCPRTPALREAVDRYRATVTYWRDERNALVEFDEGADGLEIVGLYFKPTDGDQPVSLFGLPKSLKRLGLRGINVNDEELLAELAELDQLETLNLFNTGQPPTEAVAGEPGRPAQPALPGTRTRPGRPYIPADPGTPGSAPMPWKPGLTDHGIDGLAQLDLQSLKTVILDDDEKRVSAAAVQRFEQTTGARVIRHALADQPPPCCPQLEEQPQDGPAPQQDSPNLFARLPR